MKMKYSAFVHEKKQPIFEKINNISIYRVKELFYSKLLAKYKMLPNNLSVKVMFFCLHAYEE
jgi:hypothetical protein